MMSKLLRTALLICFVFPTVVVAKTSGNWWNKAVFYQIFPYSFYDSDGDGYGDLKGIAQKLDYLEYLGINAIWLNPIHPRPVGSYHGYAVTDYYAIDEKLGTMKDFEFLIKEAHKRNIKIVMDLVMNHTSIEHPWFIDSATKKGSKYSDWYIWSPNNPGWPNPTGSTSQAAWNKYEKDKEAARYGQYYYSAFNMSIPDLNHMNKNVEDEFKKIAKFWLNKGVDGFRIDAARYLIEVAPGEGQVDTKETIKYVNNFAKYCKSINPDAYIITEVYIGANISSLYYDEDGVDAQFNFELGGKTGVIMGALQVGKPQSFYRVIKKFLADAAKNKAPITYFSHFFSNHDSGRMPENLKSYQKIKAAAAIFFTIPGGAPYIYYGDEIGEREGYEKFGDVNKRNPMYWNNEHNAGFTTREWPWVKKMKAYYMDPAKAKDKYKKEAYNCNVEYQKNDPQSVLQLFRKLIALRQKYASLYEGDIELIEIDKNELTVLD